MQTQEALLTRTTVHDYTTDPLPPGALDRALAAAVMAPNHRMTEPWRFTVVGPRARQDLASIGVDLKRAKAGDAFTEAAEQKQRRKMIDPAALIVVSQVRCSDPEIEFEDHAAVACAVQNLMLSLWDQGVGSKWSSGAITQSPATYDRLGIDPAAERILGFLWAGIPKQSPAPAKPARKRPPAEVRRDVD